MKQEECSIEQSQCSHLQQIVSEAPISLISNTSPLFLNEFYKKKDSKVHSFDNEEMIPDVRPEYQQSSDDHKGDYGTFRVRMSEQYVRASTSPTTHNMFPEIKVTDFLLKPNLSQNNCSFSSHPSTQLPQTDHLLEQINKVPAIRNQRTSLGCVCDKDKNISCQNCIIIKTPSSINPVPMNFLDPHSNEITLEKLLLTNIESTPRTPTTVNNGSNSASSNNQINSNLNQSGKIDYPNFTSIHQLGYQDQNKVGSNKKQFKQIQIENDQEQKQKQECVPQKENGGESKGMTLEHVDQVVDLEKKTPKKMISEKEEWNIQEDNTSQNQHKSENQNNQKEQLQKIMALIKKQINFHMQEQKNGSATPTFLNHTQDFKDLGVKSAFSQINVGQEESKLQKNHLQVPIQSHQLDSQKVLKTNNGQKSESNQKESNSNKNKKSKLISFQSIQEPNFNELAISNNIQPNTSLQTPTYQFNVLMSERSPCIENIDSERQMSAVYIKNLSKYQIKNQKRSKECEKILEKLRKCNNTNQVTSILSPILKDKSFFNQIINNAQLPFYTREILTNLKFAFNSSHFLKREVIKKIKLIEDNHMVAFAEKKIELSIFFKIIECFYREFHLAFTLSLAFWMISIMCLIFCQLMNPDLLHEILLFAFLTICIVSIFIFNFSSTVQSSSFSSVYFVAISLCQILIISLQLASSVNSSDIVLKVTFIRVINILSLLIQTFYLLKMCQAAKLFLICFKITPPPPPLPPPNKGV